MNKKVEEDCYILHARPKFDTVKSERCRLTLFIIVSHMDSVDSAQYIFGWADSAMYVQD